MPECASWLRWGEGIESVKIKENQSGLFEDNFEHLKLEELTRKWRGTTNESNKSNDFKKICSFYQDDGCSGAFNTGYLATSCEKVSTQHLDKDEFIRYFECSIEEVYELLENEYIKDVGSQLLLEKARQYIKK